MQATRYPGGHMGLPLLLSWTRSTLSSPHGPPLMDQEIPLFASWPSSPWTRRYLSSPHGPLSHGPGGTSIRLVAVLWRRGGYYTPRCCPKEERGTIRHVAVLREEKGTIRHAAVLREEGRLCAEVSKLSLGRREDSAQRSLCLLTTGYMPPYASLTTVLPGICLLCYPAVHR